MAGKIIAINAGTSFGFSSALAVAIQIKERVQIKKPEPQTITAWYASETPVSFGPNGVWGLPGLILQLENENYIYFCTKVSLKNNEKVKIKIPNSGKVISKKEYEKYEKKMQKQMEHNDGEFMIREIKN